MDKETLRSILSTPYDQLRWTTVLREVFGATNLRQTPNDIKNRLSGDDGKIAKAAFELGSFETADGRVVGHCGWSRKPGRKRRNLRKSGGTSSHFRIVRMNQSGSR